MLMIGTAVLAERLYIAWKERQDILNPVPDENDEEGWRSFKGNTTRSYFHARRTRPHPLWKHLTAQEQDVWKHVAEAAGRIMADAMGALP